MADKTPSLLLDCGDATDSGDATDGGDATDCGDDICVIVEDVFIGKYPVSLPSGREVAIQLLWQAA